MMNEATASAERPPIQSRISVAETPLCAAVATPAATTTAPPAPAAAFVSGFVAGLAGVAATAGEATSGAPNVMDGSIAFIARTRPAQPSCLSTAFGS